MIRYVLIKLYSGGSLEKRIGRKSILEAKSKG